MESTRFVFDGAQAIFKTIRKIKNGFRMMKNCITGLDNFEIVKTRKNKQEHLVINFGPSVKLC